MYHHMELNIENITNILGKIIHPVTGEHLLEKGMISGIELSGKTVRFNLVIERNSNQPLDQIKKTCTEVIQRQFGQHINVDIKTLFAPLQKEQPVVPDFLKDIKNIIAIASGKGGVGKSTIAVNLAVAMAATGARVGLLDADIYGPSVPKMFNLENQRPGVIKQGETDVILPIKKYGISLQSIGFFVNPDDALVWRGPMATSALKQLITQTNWEQLDYLFIDMPPGTGDVHLTLVQTLAVTGVIIVSTPQQVALADVKKGINMFSGRQVNVPVLGLVENMAWFTPAELPENKYYIFGREGCRQLAEQLNLPLLAQIPIVQSICENSDDGIPPAIDHESISGKIFSQFAKRVVEVTDERNQLKKPTQKVEIH